MKRIGLGKQGMVVGLSLVLALGLLLTTELPKASASAGAKYVFLFIGDGMGLPQRMAAAQYSGKQLAMDSLPAQGITTTTPPTASSPARPPRPRPWPRASRPTSA